MLLLIRETRGIKIDRRALILEAAQYDERGNPVKKLCCRAVVQFERKEGINRMDRIHRIKTRESKKRESSLFLYPVHPVHPV
jgi:hypothetical protein